MPERQTGQQHDHPNQGPKNVAPHDKPAQMVPDDRLQQLLDRLRRQQQQLEAADEQINRQAPTPKQQQQDAHFIIDNDKIRIGSD
eukprot:SAG22_NODE_321_length_12398_cov_3.218392_11_plen_85_part_00